MEEACNDVPSLEQLMQDINALVVEQVGGSERIDRDRPLMDVGLDSHLLASFAEQLSYVTGVSLPSVAVLETGTIRALARRVRQQLLPAPAPSRAVSSSASVAHGRLKLAAISGRWPGCSSASSWSLAAAAADAVGVVPAARWTLTAAVDVTTLSEAQMACVQHAGFVCSAEGFDSDRFGVSAAEATAMDPQQRLLLEVSYEALHSAGRRRHELLQSGAALGVFVGITNTDFAAQLAVKDSVYTATGAAISIAAGRISFVLGLQGPCQSIDTACSSAVVALHAASLSLAVDDCDSALAGAVSLILSPRSTIAYAGAGMLSTDGRCKTWDAQANGYVRGEGVGAALLQRDCQHDCRLELASSIVRQDGRSASLTAPSGSAQTTLLAGAFHRAAVQIDSLQLIEAHGTGTALGDPTESRALLQSLESEIPSKWTPQRVVLSGIKASVGHLEPAAGMVGLARLALSLVQRVAASNAQLRKVNPIVAISLREVREPRPVLGLHGFQIRSAGAVAGGISSFGEQRGSIPTLTLTLTLTLTPSSPSP
jgi:acyl transferase domain-containing protein